jgi:protein TonB
MSPPPLIDAPRVRLFVPSRAWGGRRRREILLAAAAIAVLAHVLAVLAILAAQRLSPHPAAVPPLAQDPPTIEMVEDQNRYAGGSKPTPPATPTPPAPPAPPAPPKQAGAPDPSDQQPPAPATADETTPPDAKKSPDPQQQAPSPTPQAQQQQPEVALDPADGLGYGHQDDPHIIPASPDSHANKMPPYPRAAGRRGEEGSVQMLVRIAADGSVEGIDVAVSSGYPDLDETATRAVSHWHFRPAIRDGVPVPTQMMQVFNYHIDR